MIIKIKLSDDNKSKLKRMSFGIIDKNEDAEDSNNDGELDDLFDSNSNKKKSKWTQLKLKDKQGSTTEVQEAVNNYLKSIALDKTTIGYMPISAEIYKLDNVEEVISLSITVNGTVMDTNVTPFVDSVTIGSEEIAVLDTANSEWGVQ